MVLKVILSANQFGINVKKVQKIVSNLRHQDMTKKLLTKDRDNKDQTKSEIFDEELDYDDSSYADMDLDYTTQY